MNFQKSVDGVFEFYSNLFCRAVILNKIKINSETKNKNYSTNTLWHLCNTETRKTTYQGFK